MTASYMSERGACCRYELLCLLRCLVGLGRYFVRTRRNSRRIQPNTIWCPQADFLRLHSAFRETAHGMDSKHECLVRDALLIALQSALVPRLPIILTDGTDVFVANAPNAKQAADALAIASSGAVLGGGECNSFPKCYTPVYANHTEFLACRNASHQTGQACYPNSGFLLASSTTLAESLMPAFEALALQFSNTSHPGPEAGNPDQAALHRLYAEAQDSSVRVQIDSTSEFVLNLYGCPADWRASAKADPHYVWLAPHHYTRRKPGNVNYHYCFDEPHEPLRHLSLDNATLSYAYSESGVVRFPLLLHANGNHARLMDARVRMRELESRLWTANHAGRYPILFIDAAKQVAGGCTLGNLSALASLAKR